MREIIKVFADRTWPKMDGEGYDKDFYCDFGIGSWVQGHIHFDLSNIECEKPFKLTSLNLTLSYGNGNTFVVKGANRIDDYESVKFSKGSYTAVPLDYKATENEIEFTILPFSQTNINYFNDETHEEPPYLEITKITPEIKNFKIEGDSIDGTISCTWEQEDVQKWTFEVIQDGNTVLIQNGTEANTTFNAGSLKHGGKTNFKLTAWYESKSVTKEIEVDLKYTKATAFIIDIPGTTINVDEKLTISWVSKNQTSFLLSIDGKNYTGTTETSITLPAGTISHGQKEITLTVNYNGPYYSNSDTISTSFIAYGKPNTPYFTCKSLVSSANPYLTWNSDSQISYNLTIKRILTVIESTGEVINSNKYYKVNNALENNTNYVAELKIKNQYGLWSDSAILEFSTQFDVPNSPSIQAFSNNGSIMINVSTNTDGDLEYKNTEIWKREPLGDWKRMAYNMSSDDAWKDDYVCSGIKYEYKARNIGHKGGISESDIVTCTADVKGYTLYSVEDMNKSFTFKYDVKISPLLVTNIVSNIFAGSDAPHVSTDGVMYWNTNIMFSTKNRDDINTLISLMKTNKPLLFKDCKGHKMFGNIVSGIQPQESDLGVITINFEFLETSFLEENVYSGDNTGLKLIRWDGTWRFDGTHSFH